jgi:galactose mutarotase-like enzyme
MNQATFQDKNTNVRGGNPVLFPISGQLEDGQYEWGGQTYRMNNHGVARDMAWDVVDTAGAGESQQREHPQNPHPHPAAAITLSVHSTPETIRSYPFEFELLFTYTLNEAVLTIQQEYRNTGDEDMPIYAGFHPYFLCDNLNMEYETDAVSMFNGQNSQESPFIGKVDLTGNDSTVLLRGAKSGMISFKPIAGERAITMTYGPEFKYTMLWTIQGQPFICVEPWMARSQEIYRGQELVWVRAGESLHTFLTIGLES